MPRFRAVPWMVALEAAMVARDRWGRLEANERRQLAQLVRKGRGMTEREKRELKALVAKLDLLGAGRELLPLGRKARRGRRR